MFEVYFTLISASTLNLSVNVNLSAANGCGGVFLNWSTFDNENGRYYFIVEQKDESGIWRPISTYRAGSVVNVLNVYPCRCSKPNYFSSSLTSYHQCQASKYNGNSYQTYDVNYTYDSERNKLNHTLPRSAALKVWMEGGSIYENKTTRTFYEPIGKENCVGDQQINVTLMSLEEFHDYLKESN